MRRWFANTVLVRTLLRFYRMGRATLTLLLVLTLLSAGVALWNAGRESEDPWARVNLAPELPWASAFRSSHPSLGYGGPLERACQPVSLVHDRIWPRLPSFL